MRIHLTSMAWQRQGQNLEWSEHTDVPGTLQGAATLLGEDVEENDVIAAENIGQRPVLSIPYCSAMLWPLTALFLVFSACGLGVRSQPNTTIYLPTTLPTQW